MRSILSVILLVISIVMSVPVQSQESTWQSLSADTVRNLTVVSESMLSKSMQDYPIDDILAVSYNSLFFVSVYNDSEDKNIWWLWDYFNNQILLEQESMPILSINVSHNGNFLAITSKNEDGNRVTTTCLWSIISLEKSNCWITPLHVDSIFTYNEALFILPSNQGKVIGWDILENRQKFEIPLFVVSMSISYNQSFLALDETDIISIWDITSETPVEIHRNQLTDRLSVQDITFDITGQYLFFMTIPVLGDNLRELTIRDLNSNDTLLTHRDIFTNEVFSNSYGRLFLYTQSESRLIADVINPIAGENYGSLNPLTVYDYTIAQDIFIARDEAENGFTWSVKNFETQETLFTLYKNADDSLLDVRFTQDERFIIAYTEGGLVQLWGVPAEV